MSDYAINEPQWETTEQGWHAVAALCSKGYQWTAYIEYVDAPYWRIWAGCLFEDLRSAQRWCRAEIEHQMQRNPPPPPAPASDWTIEPEAWQWLWNTLSNELGETRVTEIRNELARRLREHAVPEQVSGSST
ncbi:MAG: hypothetical protein HC884_15480 [Chloroflexaceae bacterium]|nr:hypothetical protein [Chloroflexaceae bacterium]